MTADSTSVVVRAAVTRTSPTRWQPQPLQPADVPQLLDLQAACYGGDLLESAAVYARRLNSPAQCGLAMRDEQGALRAYLAAYWSVRGAVTPLHGDYALHAHADTLYLHDLAVHPSHAGQGLAQALLSEAWAQAEARGVHHAALVSVQGTAGFWQRQGFAPASATEALDSYGAGAVYMVRELPGLAAQD